MKNSENVDGNAEDVKILILKQGKNVIDVAHQ
jgi:hypothetical protein